jgi:hypothetical protein
MPSIRQESGRSTDPKSDRRTEPPITDVRRG